MNIVIVGGGTAGCLTALYAKKIFPEKALRILNNTAFGKLKIYIPTNDILYLGFRK